MVQFADLFQFGFQFLVVLQPLLDLRFHFRADAVLLGDTAGVGDAQHPNGMAFAARTFGTTLLMANHALQERTTENLVSGREAGDQFLPLEERLFMFHLYI